MVNAFSNIQKDGLIAKAAAQTLSDNVQFSKSVAKFENNFFEGKNGYSAGDKITVNIPATPQANSTLDATGAIQDVVETVVTTPLNITVSVPMETSSLEFATDIQLKNILERYILPASRTVASQVESQALSIATNAVYNSVGTAGTTTFNTATVLAAKTKMAQALCPYDDRNMLLLDSAATASAVTARNSFFQDAAEVSKQYRMGAMGKADGFTYLSNELLTTQTNGTMGGTPLVNGAAQTGASLITDTWGATGTITQGTVFTIAGVNKVHPITKVDTGVLQQFVVTADATAVATAATLSISPSIVVTGSTQNVTASPANNAVITPVGAASSALKQSLAYHKDAFRLISVPLVMPKNAEFAEQYQIDGMNLAIVRDYDNTTRKMLTRVDFLGALLPIRTDHACRITA